MEASLLRNEALRARDSIIYSSDISNLSGSVHQRTVQVFQSYNHSVTHNMG